MEKPQYDDFSDSSEETLSIINFVSFSDKKCCILLDPSLRGGIW